MKRRSLRAISRAYFFPRFITAQASRFSRSQSARLAYGCVYFYVSRPVPSHQPAESVQHASLNSYFCVQTDTRSLHAHRSAVFTLRRRWFAFYLDILLSSCPDGRTAFQDLRLPTFRMSSLRAPYLHRCISSFNS